MRSERLKRLVRLSIPRPVRNWLRSPSKSLEWIWDAAMFSVGLTKRLQIAPNISIICHPRAFKVAYEAQIADPEQKAEFQSFISHCSNRMVLYDIGAHFGIFSLVAAHFGGSAIAVDASPAATHMIGIQANLNKVADKVQIIHAAVSDANDAIGMVSSGVFSDGYFTATRQEPKGELTQVQATTIDQMALQFGPPTHIKIDVEGHEAAVLRGGRATLSQFSPLLFLELHNKMMVSTGEDPCVPLNELAQLRYDTFTPDGDMIGVDAILAKPIIRIVGKRRIS